jgi:DNA-directed RNA polymerase sigma subunit (sigma70/sigma32)
MSHDPSDQEVSQFIRDHPGGGTIYDLAAIFGVTHQRIQQIEKRALEKLQRELSWHRIYEVGDGM